MAVVTEISQRPATRLRTVGREGAVPGGGGAGGEREPADDPQQRGEGNMGSSSDTEKVGREGKDNRGKRKRRRDIVWYNPPYNACITSNLGKNFLSLIDRHFPKTRKDNLQKIINRHTIKISYSTTPNMKYIINAHNTKVLNNHNKHNDTPEDNTKDSKKIQRFKEVYFL